MPANAVTNFLIYKINQLMRKLLLFVAATLAMYYSFAQLEVIDAENITRERWRDSMLRMDMSQVSTGFLMYRSKTLSA